jgi:hypothetical protein
MLLQVWVQRILSSLFSAVIPRTFAKGLGRALEGPWVTENEEFSIHCLKVNPQDFWTEYPVRVEVSALTTQQTRNVRG